MNDSPRHQRLRAAYDDAMARVRRAESALADGAPPAVGDVYVTGVPSRLALRWVVVAAEGDACDVAPGDDNPQLGVGDLWLPAGPLAESMSLRLGHAVRIAAERLRGFRRVGRVDVGLLQRRQDAPGDGAGRALDVDLAPWMDEVAAARRALEERLRCRSLHLRAAPADEALALPLAAAQGGLLGEVTSSLLAGGARSRAALELPCPPKGSLLLLPEEEGVTVVSVPGGGDPPEVTGADARGRPLVARWERSPEGGVYRADRVFPWREGRVSLFVAVGDGVEVTLTP